MVVLSAQYINRKKTMKKISLSLFAIPLVVVFCSCKEVRNSDYIQIDNAETLDWQSFPLCHLTEKIIIEDIEEGDPVNLSLIDSLLFMTNLSGKKMLHVYSIPGERLLGGFGNRGRGPNELLSMEYVYPGFREGTGSGYDVTSGRWLQFKIAESLESGNFVVDSIVNISKEKDKYYLDNPVRVSDGKFAAVGFLNLENRCFVTDLNLDSYLEFVNPDITFRKKMPDNILADMYAPHLSVKPDKSRIALAGGYIDLVEIFGVDGTHIFTGVGPVLDLHIDIDVARSSERQVFMKTDETRRAFLSVKSTDEYIYLLYSGKQKQDPSHYSSGSLVYVINWDGEPVAHFELDASVWDIEISSDNKSLYGIKSSLPSLIQYDLNLP